MRFLTPAGRVIACYLFAGLLAHQIAFGSGAAGEASEAESCRCAVLYSGHVRSFAQPRVYQSHKKHLIEQLETDCHVDVFMYISGEREPDSRGDMRKASEHTCAILTADNRGTDLYMIEVHVIAKVGTDATRDRLLLFELTPSRVSCSLMC